MVAIYSRNMAGLHQDYVVLRLWPCIFSFLLIHLYFSFEALQGDNSLKFSNFEIPILKIFEQFLPVILQTSKEIVKFSSLFFCSKHIMILAFLFY